MRTPVGRGLAVLAAAVGAAVLGAAPAHADPNDELYVRLLTDSHVPYDDPASAVAIGHSICTMYTQGMTQTAIATKVVADHPTVDYATALTYTAAVTVLCPDTVKAAQANGQT